MKEVVYFSVMSVLLIAGTSFADDGLTVSDLNAKNSAYLKHELAQVLSCNYPNSAFSTNHERLNFIFKNAIEVSEGDGQFSNYRFDGSARLNSAAGGGKIRFSEWPNNGTDPKYILTFTSNEGASVSIQGITKDKISFPPLESIKDQKLLDLYTKLKLGLLTCSVAPKDPLIFDSEDFTTTVQLIVHPHDYYDPQGKITKEINFWQAQPGIRTIALLESMGPRTVEEIITGAPFKSDDSKLTFTPNPQTRFHVAPNGVLEVDDNQKIPSQFILTGGWFNACMTHALDSLFEGLRANTQNGTISVGLPLNGILVQPEGEDGMNTYPEMSPETTLAELRNTHPEVFTKLMEKFLSHYLNNWKTEEEYLIQNPQMMASGKYQPIAVSLEILDENGISLGKQSWGESELPRSNILFHLIAR